jgi:hypothetical protein
MMTSPKASPIPRDMVTGGEIFFLSPLKKPVDKQTTPAIFTFVRQTLFLK